MISRSWQTHQEGGERLDYQNFADYMLLLSYMGTTDWPRTTSTPHASGHPVAIPILRAGCSAVDGRRRCATCDRGDADRLLAADDTTIKILSALMQSEESGCCGRIDPEAFFGGGALTGERMMRARFSLSDAAARCSTSSGWSRSTTAFTPS